MLFVAKKRTLLSLCLLATALLAFSWSGPTPAFSSRMERDLGEWGHLSNVKTYLPLEYCLKQNKCDKL